MFYNRGPAMATDVGIEVRTPGIELAPKQQGSRCLWTLIRASRWVLSRRGADSMEVVSSAGTTAQDRIGRHSCLPSVAEPGSTEAGRDPVQGVAGKGQPAAVCLPSTYPTPPRRGGTSVHYRW